MKRLGWVLVVLVAMFHTPRAIAQAEDKNPSHLSADHKKLELLSAAIILYKSHTGRYPRRLEHLLYATGHQSWKGPYIKASWLYDQHKHMVRYRYIRRKMEVRFSGHDGVFYTKDDVAKKIRVNKATRR